MLGFSSLVRAFSPIEIDSHTRAIEGGRVIAASRNVSLSNFII